MASANAQWTVTFREMVDRNIGLLNESQQERLRRSKVCVAGLGGLGGTVFEVLVRCGIGKFWIVDKDVFEPSNMNRQVLADRNTLGRLKIEVAEEWARSVNPDVEIARFDRVGEDNVQEMIQGSNVIVMAIDQLKPCIVIARKARELGILMVEGWALPYANVRVLTPETPSLEEAYGLPTVGRSISSITEAELRQLTLALLAGFGRIDGIAGFYSEDAIRQIANGRITSFAPMVWLTAILMATETVKVLLGLGNLATRDFAFYDPFHHRIPGMARQSAGSANNI